MLNSRDIKNKLFIPNGKLDFPVLHVGDYAINLFNPNTSGQVFLHSGPIWAKWAQSLGYPTLNASLEFIVKPVFEAESNIQNAFGHTDHIRMLVEKEGVDYVDSIGEYLKRRPINIFVNKP
jgi:hypothetical protein